MTNGDTFYGRNNRPHGPGCRYGCGWCHSRSRFAFENKNFGRFTGPGACDFSPWAAAIGAYSAAATAIATPTTDHLITLLTFMLSASLLVLRFFHVLGLIYPGQAITWILGSYTYRATLLCGRLLTAIAQAPPRTRPLTWPRLPWAGQATKTQYQPSQLLHRGPHALTVAELLAILLRDKTAFYGPGCENGQVSSSGEV